jgi:coenzyme F420 hydrogenase subunit beta
MVRIDSIEGVVRGQLCTGCGACAYIAPDTYRMVDIPDLGRRPMPLGEQVFPSKDALKVCPGRGLRHATDVCLQPGVLDDLFEGWGPVLEVWEGYASDPDIRFSGSSGGAATALALFCLEHEGMAGVLHTAARQDVPYLNETVMSTSRAELLTRSGSRYAPASPAEGLSRIENASAKCMFIGKPCDVAAAQNARRLRAGLDEKLGLVLAFFCAGVPSTRGNLDLLRTQGIPDPGKVKGLRFRGNGWPGMWMVEYTNEAGEIETRQLTYADSWGFLQKYRQWRCYICPDHSGEFADIAVGDPWYREVEPGEYGKSLIVARTPRGLEMLRAAEKTGYLVLEKEDSSLLPRSQPNLLATRGALWARLKVLRLMGAAVPAYEGFEMFRYWMRLGLKERLQSIFGTAKRVFNKKLNKPIQTIEWPDPKT